MNGRLTRINPDGETYRAPMGMVKEIRITSGERTETMDIFGDVVNRLGAYENCKSGADFEKLQVEFGIKK
ncbi:MAG: hypothetical protein PHQ72_14180 [Hespellia sp.]|nr:hypothetical protein [Hespellia sp.]